MPLFYSGQLRMKMVNNSKKSVLALPGMENAKKWFDLVEKTRSAYTEMKQKQEQIKMEKEEEKRRLVAEREQEALKFYRNCYSFPIKESTPTYQLFSDKS